jgi:drug/metabolite transporter (DMT)-like permease
VASRRIARIDVLLLVMTLIWGTNYTVVKHAFTQLDPQAFNAVRMIVASLVFGGVIAVVGWRRRAEGAPLPPRADSIASIFHSPAPITARDWLGLAGLGIVGHGLYQYCFVAGLSQTSVANSALVLAATPVLIAIMSAALGRERISPLHWLGAGLSLAGIYLVVGTGIGAGRSSLSGDLLMFAAACCFAIYTLGAQPLMTRHSPVGVTGLSMAIGTVVYVPAVLPHLRAVDWGAVRGDTWLALVYSALFALCVAYTIWYAAVREIGSARTSVYSNLVPLVAMMTASLMLGEPLSARKIAGAAAVLAGVALTRVGGARMSVPCGE